MKMPFFLRGKETKKRSKFSTDKQRKKKAPIELPKDDEEITSSEDDNISATENADIESEDENETAQDKKLRLAKAYLEEIEKLEREKLARDDVDQDTLSKRLQVDHLKESGKYRSLVAEKYSEENLGQTDILRCKEQNNTLTCLCISSDDRYVFSGSKNGNIIKYSLSDKKKVGVIPFVKNKPNVSGLTSKVTCMAISTDNKFLVTGEESKIIQVWNPGTLDHIKTLTGHQKSVTGVAFKKNSHTLYSCSADRAVKVWNLDEMTYVETLFGHQDIITSIDAMYRDRVVTAGGRDNTLRIWKITEESQLIYNGHNGCIDIVRFVTEDVFVSGGDDGQICLWSLLKKKPLYSVKEAHGRDPTNSQPFWIVSLGTLVNTDIFASGSQSGFIKIWKITDNFRKIEYMFEVAIYGVINSINFTSDGKKLLAASGRDHRFGRWAPILDAKNQIVALSLLN